MLPSAAAPDPQMERLRWPAREGFYRPDYARSLTGVFPTMAALLGHPVAERPDLLPFLPAGSPRRAKRVLLLTLDAFGFKELAQSERLRALYGEYGTWITSVFPTITSCALSSLYQALPPARHGVPGHVIWKDFPGAVVDMLRMAVPGARASLDASGFDVKRWQREPGLLDAPNGLPPGYQLMNRHIVGSGLSQLIYGRTRLVGFIAPLEGLTKAAQMLSEQDGWVGVYLEDVDSLSHVLTGDSPQMGLTVRHIEQCLAWMVRAMPRAVAEETALLVVADHGQSTIEHRLPLYGDADKWLKEHTRAVGNSGRVLHVYLDAHHDAGRVAAWLREFVGSHGQVFSFDEVKSLTGPPLDGSNGSGAAHGAMADHEAWVRQSLGDLVVLLDDGWNWQKRDPAKDDQPYESRLVSQHGSLTWNEVFVPFLCAPLTALAEG